ncbi:MAG: sulfatase [Anaerolineae bacterium]
MNLIVVMLDSFRQDHVGVYHGGQPAFADVPACRTPNLDGFARDCIVFDNAYPEGLPTIPVRTALMTGQQTLPFRPWQPLTKEDITVAEVLGREGYVCGIVSDCYHYRAPGMNFHRGFHAYRWVRGQEYDPYESGPTRRSVDDYVNANYPPIWRDRVTQFLANTDDFRGEEDWFAAKVVDEAIHWLERNRGHEKTFLWIDSFEPHEPWDPPARFDVYRDPSYHGKRLIMPMGGPYTNWATPEEVRDIRGLYAGEAAFVDDCLGRLFQAMERLGYLEDSAVLIVADHGHPLGDHGKFLKGGDRLHSELLKVPFLLRLPGGRGGGRHSEALVQFHDVLPTLLDLMGLSNDTGAMHGRSFRPVVEGDTDEYRDAIVVGYHEGADRCIRNRRWSLVLRPPGEPDELYDLQSDPGERRNLIDEERQQAEALARRFGPYFRGRGAATAVKGIQGAYEVASGAVE